MLQHVQAAARCTSRRLSELTHAWMEQQGAGAAYKGVWTAGTSTLSCRWSQAARHHIASLVGRRGISGTASGSKSSASQTSDVSPRLESTNQQQTQPSPSQPAIPDRLATPKTLRPTLPMARRSSTSSETPHSHQHTVPIAAKQELYADLGPAAQLREHSTATGKLSESANGHVAATAHGHSSATQTLAVAAVSATITDNKTSLPPNVPNDHTQPGSNRNQSAAGQGGSRLSQDPTTKQPPRNRPKPRRSSSAIAAADDDRHTVPDREAAKTNLATKQTQGGQSAAAQRPVQPSQPSQPATPQQQQQHLQQPPLNMQLRNSVNSRKRSTPLVLPSLTLSKQAETWLKGLGVCADHVKAWRAGMATVPHPNPAQGQVEVFALPYYHQGTLVNLRYYQLEDGQLVATWLAKEAAAPFMNEQLVQDAKLVVFVNDELDAVLLSALGIAAVALPQQRPVLDIAAYQQPDQRQQPQHLWPLLQVSYQRGQQQSRSNLQQNTEDPWLRLRGLDERIKHLQTEHRINASRMQGIISSSSNGSDGLHSSEGLIVSDVLHHQKTGLKLMFPAATTAVIAMDSGQVGEAVAAELARLLGEVSCRSVTWPVAGTPAGAAAHFASSCAGPGGTPLAEYWSGMKWHLDWLDDLGISQWNFLLVYEMYQRHNQSGADAVRTCIDNAVIWPIPGLERFSDYADQLVACWDTPDVGSTAVETGWPSLDEYYKVAPGEVTIVTGVPNSGKSEWLDALAVNLALQHGWRFAVCSMEKRPRDHARQLLEKIAGKPLLMAAYAENVDRMSEQDLCDAYRWLTDHFYVIASGASEMPKIQTVLEKAKAAKIYYNINGLIIDPYNELDPTRSGSSVKEHEHINELMAHLRRFARDNKVHCWLVAHPRQMGNLWTGQPPGLQDISGGANFHNKADNGIVVHRDWSKMKEMQQRAGKATGGSRRASRSSSPALGGNSGSDNGTAEGADNDPAAPAHNAEFEVQIKVEKVRNKMSGARGMTVLVYDRVTCRYHEIGEEPDRSCLWEELHPVRRMDEDTILTVEDAPADDTQQTSQQNLQAYEAGGSDSYSGPDDEEENMQRLKEQAEG